MFHHERARTFLDHFLMPTLYRAFPFTKMYGTALSIAENLDFNVMTIRVIALDKHSRVFEEVFSTRSDHGEGVHDLFDILADREPHTSTTGSGLQHHWESQSLAFVNGIFLVADQSLRAWYYRHSGLRGDISRSMLDTEGLDALGTWSHPDHARGPNGPSEICIL